MPNRDQHITNSLLNSFKAFIGSHFLLNIINGIQSDVILKSNKSAFDSLQQFNRIYKLALKQSNAQFSSLEDALQFLKIYGSLEQLRFPNKKFPAIKHAEVNMEHQVPTYIFQSFVENAWLLCLETTDKKFDISISTKDDTCSLHIDLNSTDTKHAKAAAKLELAINRLNLLQDNELITYSIDWNHKSFFSLTIQTL